MVEVDFSELKEIQILIITLQHFSVILIINMFSALTLLCAMLML